MNPPKLFSNCVPMLCLLLAFVANTHSATITIEPSADTSLFEGAPNNNLGGSTNLISGTTGQNNFSRALLKFAVASQVPSNSIVTSAKLVLRVVQLPATPADSNFDLHQLLFDWGEGEKTGDFGNTASAGEATWNDRFFSQAAWTAPGASDTGDYLETSSASTFIGGLGNYEFTNLVVDVQFWLDHPADNFGWILISESENTVGTIKQFGSRESADPAVRPKLVIDYTPRVILTPVADTSLFELGPDNNLGADILAAGTILRMPGFKNRALIMFDIAGNVPSNAIITSARLNLSVVMVPPLPVDSNFELHRMLLSWVEGDKTSLQGSLASPGETTWNSRFHPSTSWSAPGASAPIDFSPTVSSSQAVTGLGGYEFPNLATDVQFWLNNSAQNFGWILVSDAEDELGSARRFGSRESDPSVTPQLFIEYAVPPHIDSVGTAAGNQFTIHFTAKAGHAYVVECRDALSESGTTCTNLPVQGATGPVSVSLPLTGTQRFFRVGEQ